MGQIKNIKLHIVTDIKVTTRSRKPSKWVPNSIPLLSLLCICESLVEKSVPHRHWPLKSVPLACRPKKLVTTLQNRQAKIDVVPSAASLIIKALKEPPRDRKKVK